MITEYRQTDPTHLKLNERYKPVCCALQSQVARTKLSSDGTSDVDTRSTHPSL